MVKTFSLTGADGHAYTLKVYGVPTRFGYTLKQAGAKDASTIVKLKPRHELQEIASKMGLQTNDLPDAIIKFR